MKKQFFVISLLLLTFVFTDAIKAGGHDNHLGLFVGAANNRKAEHTDFALGLDYERRLSLSQGLFGIGVIGEVVFAEHKEYLIMGGIFVHATPSLKFVLGNGVAIAEHEDHGVTETHSEYILRVGAAYDIHVANFTVSPTFNYDTIKGHATLVYGVTFGVGF